MPNLLLDFHAVCRMRSGVVFGSPLLMPEVSGIGRDEEEVVGQLTSLVAKFLAELPARERYRRVVASAPELDELCLVVEPPRKEAAWETPVELRLSYVCWAPDESQRAAHLPALDLTFVAAAEDFEKRLETEVKATLLRRGVSKSFAAVQQLHREEPLSMVRFSVEVELPTPRQRAEREREESKPVLPEVATRIRAAKLSPEGEAFEQDGAVRDLAEALGGRRPRSVLLVGPSGVGKSAVFRELVRQSEREPSPLREYAFWITSGSRLVSGVLGFGGWQERCQTLGKEVAKQRVVLHLGGLHELIEVGRCGGSAGIGEFLRPALERGELLAVAECTPEERSLIERQNPGLLDAFFELRMAEPDAPTCRRILEKEMRRKRWGSVPMTEAAIDELDRLHRRYATASVAPGRPLRFLRNLIEDCRRGESVLEAEDVIDAFSRETGLPRFLLHPACPMNPVEVRDWFASRVLGQPEAVQVVVDLLAVVKTRMARPGKPLASLLFLGPTGVGKTEMSKALAEFFFDRTRMIRIDASEYGDPAAIGRLTGSVGSDEGILTSKVRDQPFGVVLFDEFEKAHPLFFDLLLQVLGEGRLTDASGRLADFRNSVIVMTSNLGAESVRKGAVGFGTGADAAAGLREEYLKHVREFLRPEMFNRIDRVVPFVPLDDGTLRRIARNELKQVEQREGLRGRKAVVPVSEEAVHRLTALGTEPQFGARPLKRAIERHLLAPLASQLNRYSMEERLETSVSLGANEQNPAESGEANPGAGAIDVRVRALPRSAEERESDQHWMRVADECGRLRRMVYRAEGSPLALDLRNELFRLQRDEARWLERPGSALPFDAKVAARLGRLRQIDSDLRGVFEDVTSLEDSLLTAVYGSSSGEVPPNIPEWLASAARRWEEQLFFLYEHQLGDAESASLLFALYSDNPEALVEIGGLYRDLARGRAFEVSAWALRSCQGNYERKLPEGVFRVGEPEDKKGDPKSAGEPRPQEDSAKAKGNEAEEPEVRPTILEAHPLPDADMDVIAHKGAVGVLLSIRGRLSRPFFERESGLHRQKQSKDNPWHWLIHVGGGSPAKYRPPSGIDRRDGFTGFTRRREYVGWESLTDSAYGKIDLGKNHRTALAEMLLKRLRREAEEAVAS